MSDETWTRYGVGEPGAPGVGDGVKVYPAGGHPPWGGTIEAIEGQHFVVKPANGSVRVRVIYVHANPREHTRPPLSDAFTPTAWRMDIEDALTLEIRRIDNPTGEGYLWSTETDIRGMRCIATTKTDADGIDEDSIPFGVDEAMEIAIGRASMWIDSMRRRLDAAEARLRELRGES